VKNQYDTWDFLKHGNSQMEKIEQGSRTTKFHKGFSRRRNIGQDQERIIHCKKKEESAANFAPRRCDKLISLDTGYNGFNIITGDHDPTKERNIRPQRRHVNDNQSRELKNEGAIALRDSSSRFFGPAPDSKNPVKYQNRLGQINTEGLRFNKMSSVLGIGRAEMPSYGVHDAFSASLYGAKEVKTPNLRLQQQQRAADIAAVRELK